MIFKIRNNGRKGKKATYSSGDKRADCPLDTIREMLNLLVCSPLYFTLEILLEKDQLYLSRQLVLCSTGSGSFCDGEL